MPILGGVPVTGFVSPTDERDTYATHKAQYGYGGHRTVLNLTDRDAITDERREEGMTVWVKSTSSEYRLVGGIANANWVIIAGSTIGNSRYTAGEDIESFRACIVKEGALHYADSSNTSHSRFTKYLSLTSGIQGEDIEVIEEGRYENSTLSLTVDSSYFLSTQGNASTTVPNTGFVQKLFVAETATSLFFDPMPAILL